MKHLYVNTSFRPKNQQDVASFEWIRKHDSQSECMRELTTLGRTAEQVLGPQWLHILHNFLVERKK